MPALPNIRHERFIRHYIRSGVAARAYLAAGYTASTRKSLDACASRMLANARIKARIAELQRQMTNKTKISLESLISDLADDRALARSLGQPGAAIQATQLTAKLTGLLVDRKESGAPGDFAALQTIEQIMERVKADHGADAAKLFQALLDKTQPQAAELDETPQGPLN